VIVSAVHKRDIDESIMETRKVGVCALLHVFQILWFLEHREIRRRRDTRLASGAKFDEKQDRKGPLRMKLADAGQASVRIGAS
jgi:hypothetical protein